MIDPRPLWDFEDPPGSERRLRQAAEAATDPDRQVLLTQVARALGLQERYAEGHAVLDALDRDEPEVATRIDLERGRLLRSAGRRVEAQPSFEAAVRSASAAGLRFLHVDALHMVALAADALAACRRVGDPSRVRIARWMVGWALRQLGRTAEALVVQLDLRGELDRAGLSDPYVEEELALLEPAG